jgi:hypothetical protein
MPRTKTILRSSSSKYFYLVDANFLANKFIPYARVTNKLELQRVRESQEWWVEIDRQLNTGRATVYVLDVCIAECFKVLAKKYYRDKYFRNSREYKFARDLLIDFVQMKPKTLKSANRKVKVHDISTSRDIVISVDRFYEVFAKHGLNASVVDLLILATAKYLIDFYSVPTDRFFIVTLDDSLWRGAKKIADLPWTFNPMRERVHVIFRNEFV